MDINFKEINHYDIPQASNRKAQRREPSNSTHSQKKTQISLILSFGGLFHEKKLHFGP